MANTVKLTIKVDDNGSLSVVAKEAKKATAETDKLGRSTDKLGKSRGRFNKGEKGVAGATSNSTKAFSKMRMEMGGGSSGLVGAYATLAANVFALTAAFGVLQRSSGVEQMSSSLTFLGNAAGTNLDIVVSRLQDVTNGALSAEQALRSASIGTSAGFSTTEMESLTKVAKGAATALGRDLGDAQDRLIRGVAKLEPEILDELGILVRLDAAATAYGAAIGKTATQLTEAERRQAFLNATLEQGASKYGDLANSIDVNAYDKLSASLSNLLKDFVTLINKGLLPFINLLSENQAALAAFSGLFLSTISSTLLPAIAETGVAMAKTAAETGEFAQSNLKNLQQVSKGSTVYGKFVEGLQDGSKTIVDYREGLTSLDRTISGHEAGMQSMIAAHGKESSAVTAKTLALKNARVERLKLIQAVQLNQISSAKETAALGLQNIAQGGVIVGLKGLVKAITEYKTALVVGGAQTGVFTGILNLLKTGAFTATLGVKALGAAFFALLGPISLVITVGLMAYDFFKDKFFPEEEVNKKSEEITKALENITNVNKQFVESMTEGSDRVIKGLTAVNGAIAQNLQLIREREIATRQSAASTGQDAQDKIAAAESRLAAAQENISKLGRGKRNRGTVGYSAMVQEVKEAEKALNSLKNTVNKSLIAASSVSLQTIEAVQTLGTELKSSELNNFAPDLVERISFLGSTLPRSTVMAQHFIQTLGTLQKEAETATGFISGLPGALQEFNKESAKLTGKNQTPFDGLLDAAIAVQSEFKNLDNISSKTKKALIDNLEAIGGKELAKSFGDSPGGAAAAVDTYVATLRKAVNTLSNLGTALKTNSVLQKSLAFSATQTATGFNALVEAQREGLRLRRDGVEAEQATLDARTSLGTEERKRLQDQIDNKTTALDIEERSLKPALKAVELTLMQTKQQQKLNNLRNDALATSQKTVQLEQKVVESAMKLANLRDPSKSGGALTPTQELAIARDFNATIEERATNEYSAKVRTASLTFLVADIELQVIEEKLRAEDKLEGARKDSLTAARTLLQENRDGIIKNAALERDLSIQNAAVAEGEAEKKVKSFGSYKGGSTSETIGNLFRRESDGKGGTVDSAAETTFGKNDDGTSKSTMNEKVEFLKAATSQMTEELSKLGPEGEFISSIVQGSFAIADGFTKAFESSATGMEKSAAVAQAVGDSIGAVNSMVQAGISATIAKLDDEINAEKKRDGKSAQSVAKIAAMEKKKEAQKKKAFEVNKKMLMAQTIANTAAGIMGALGQAPFSPLNIAMAAIIGVMGAAQLAVIAGTSFQGGGAGAAPPGTPSQITMGQRSNTSDLATSRSARGELGYMRGEDGTGGIGSFKPAFSGYKNRAEGGKAGFVVGEQGPELFVPEMPGRIVPNDDIAAGGVSNVSFNINTVDASGVEDLLVAQRGNIIGMIRQAANTYGQDFVEDVDTSTFTQSAGGVSRY